MPAMRSEQTKTIWKKYNAGQSNKEIAAEMGIKYSTVTSALTRGRADGVIPPVLLGSPLNHGTNYYLHKGTMGSLLTKLTREQLVWLTKLAEKYGCETMAEVILELVRDAHALEEQGP